MHSMSRNTCHFSNCLKLIYLWKYDTITFNFPFRDVHCIVLEICLGSEPSEVSGFSVVLLKTDQLTWLSVQSVWRQMMSFVFKRILHSMLISSWKKSSCRYVSYEEREIFDSNTMLSLSQNQYYLYIYLTQTSVWLVSGVFRWMILKCTAWHGATCNFSNIWSINYVWLNILENVFIACIFNLKMAIVNLSFNFLLSS